MYQSKHPKTYWSYALQFTSFIINRVPTHILNQQSPYQVLHNKLPESNFFKFFHSLCYASTLPVWRTKLDLKARKSIFLGYKHVMKGYVLLAFHTNEVIFSKNVIFHEHIWPNKPTMSSSSTSWPYFPSIIDKSASINQEPPNISEHVENDPNIFEQHGPISTHFPHNSPINDSPSNNTLHLASSLLMINSFHQPKLLQEWVIIPLICKTKFDYLETYSLVAKLTTVRTIIALASCMHALLHGDIHEDVYMLSPLGATTTKPNQVYKLVKSIYMLKQASIIWYERLTSFLIQHQYKQATTDHSLCMKNGSSSLTILLVCVDEVILARSDFNYFNSTKLALDNMLKIKYLGNLEYFLGIEVEQSKEGIFFNTRKCCLGLLYDSGFIKSKTVTTLFDPTIKLHQESSKPYHDIPSYRRLVGRLLYLNSTRSDIIFCTQQRS